MIRVNLLPAEMESAPSQAASPVIPLGAAVIIPILILVPIHFSKMATRKKLESDSASLKSELDRYQPIIAQVEALERAKAQLSQRKNIIQQLESERLRYPQFMDDFVKLLPGNLWLTNLTTVTQPNSNVLTVGMDVTALDNYAIADLIANLETSQIFTDVDLGSIAIAQTQAGGQSMTFHVNTIYRKLNPLPDATKNRNLAIAAAALGLVCLIFYTYYTLVYAPVGKTIQEDRHTVADLNQKLESARARAGQLSKIQAEMAGLQVDVAQLEKQLPKDRELPSLIRVFTHRAEAFGVGLSTFAPQKPVAKGLYDEIPYNVTMSGSFHSLGRFLTAMGKGERLFAARNLALTSAVSKTDMTKTVNATFTLVSFRYHE